MNERFAAARFFPGIFLLFCLTDIYLAASGMLSDTSLPRCEVALKQNKLVNNLPPTFLAGSFEPGDDGGNRGHAFWPQPSPSLPVI